MPTLSIHYAAMSGDLDETRLLIYGDFSLANVTDDYGRTPLHHAAINGHITVADFLLANGADINAKDIWGRTPLFVGIYEEPLVQDHTPITEFLISMGADINCKDEQGAAPLHMAAFFGERQIIALLLKANADINVQDTCGDTPLHYATVYPETETVRLLLSQPGVTPQSKNLKGLTPRDIAVEKGNTRSVELFDGPDGFKGHAQR